jgi:predicted TIM-barrel fold metal-dependent hydrolase
MHFADIPLLDHHCHALRRGAAPLSAAAFRGHFSESSDPRQNPHIEFSLFYRRALRDLGELLECAPTEEAVLAVRHQAPAPDYARRLFLKANISALLVDTGFRGGENYDLPELRNVLPCPVLEVLRLETVMEQLALEAGSFAELEEAYRAALSGARERGIVAYKSIAAYRGGLSVERRSRAEAAARFEPLHAQAQQDGRLRLSDRPLLEYLLRIALEEAADQELPVQFHVGFGDNDVDLRTANPLQLQPLIRDPALQNVRFVLLHNYPFVREAGYLASIYGNVYADLSLTIPFTAHGGTSALLEALELAPVSKVLLSTDAFSIPELFYLGSLYARACLSEALDQLQRRGWLLPDEIHEIAERLLHRNSQAIYAVA